MQGSVAPMFVGQAPQELYLPLQSQNTAWYHSARSSARPMLPRHSALFSDGAGNDDVYPELWPSVSGPPPPMMLPDGYVRLSDAQCAAVTAADDRVYVSQLGGHVYAVPHYPQTHAIYNYGAAHMTGVLRPPIVSAPGYRPVQSRELAGRHWSANHLGIAHAGNQMLGTGSVLHSGASAPGKQVSVNYTPNGYATYAAREYVPPHSPATNATNESCAWVSPPDSLLTLFKSNPNGVKLTLEDIIGHVVSFCKDQDGSKLLQKLLKPLIVQDNTSVSLQLVIAEMEPHVLKLMKHIYGRFVFIAFLGTWGSKYRSLVVEWMHGHFDELATDRYGYAVVKEALKNCDATLRLQIAAELHPSIARIAEDVFGHDVVCVLTESIPTSDLEETVNVLVETLNFQNQYSCSVAMALLDAMAYSDPRRACIITKMRLNAHVLAKSSRGILMLERLLDIGTAQEATDVAVMLIPNLVVEELTEHSCAVLLKSLERGGAIARSLFVAVVLQGGQLNIVRHLMNQEYGKEVLQEVSQVLTGLERDALGAHIEKVSQMY